MKEKLVDVDYINVISVKRVGDLATIHDDEFLRIILNQLKEFTSKLHTCKDENGFSKLVRQAELELKNSYELYMAKKKIDENFCLPDIERCKIILTQVASSLKSELF